MEKGERKSKGVRRNKMNQGNKECKRIEEEETLFFRNFAIYAG